RERLAALEFDQIVEIFERERLPYAPITRPQDLLRDPHLNATGGLAPMTIPADASPAGRHIETKTALLPLTLAGMRPPLRSSPPSIGQHTTSLLHELGYEDFEIDSLRQAAV